MGILLFLLLVLVLVNLAPVQTWIVQQVAGSFSKKLHTKVSIKKIDINFFNRLLLRDLLVEDKKGDTLVFAGTARLSITDWFFFKDKAEIKYVGLEDAKVNMYRTDSVWNYQFLIDYFASPSSGNKNQKQIEFNLKEAHFKNIEFVKKDGWIGQDLTVSVKAVDLLMDGVDYKNKKVSINSLKLNKAEFAQSDYTGKRPPQNNLTTILKKIPVVSAFKWNNSGWTVSVNEIELENSRFMNDKESENIAAAGHFDGLHIDFSGITGSLRNIVMQNDTLRGTIDLSAKERSGLIVRNIKSEMKFTPDVMEFNKLLLETNKSKLQNYYSMSYKSFNKDMRNFISDVTLKAKFKESYIHSDDLAFFAPTLKKWNRLIYLEGDAEGTIENFSAKNMILKSENTFVDADVSIRGLPEINSTYISVKSRDLRSSYSEISRLVPPLKEIKTPDLAALGTIRYAGTFDGFLNDFVAYGVLNTSIGKIKADINMKLPENNVPEYSGKIFTESFNIGRLIKNSAIGKISLDGAVAGKGFDIASVNTKFNGKIFSIELASKKFYNAEISGEFIKKKFSGLFNIDDTHLKINNLNGILDFTQKSLQVNAEADIVYADLKYLDVSKKDLNFNGKVDLNFSGNNIDDFTGYAKISNASLKTTTNIIDIDSLSLSSLYVNNNKILRLYSDEIDAEISGNFSILDLPNSFKFFLSRYYPAYIKKPSYAVSNQDFIFNVRTKKVDDLVPLLDDRISGLNNSTFTGSLNIAKSELELFARIPQFSFAGKNFKNIVLNADGTMDTLRTDVAIDNIQLSDSLNFPDTRINIASNNNLSTISIKTSADKTLNDAELNASVLAMEDGVKINFFPSEFIINGKKWALEKDGELTLRKNFIDANEIKFAHGDQQIVISSEISPVTNKAEIVARLQKINTEDFIPFIFKNPEIKGLLTGTAVLSNPGGEMKVSFTGTADSFSMNKKYVGLVILNGDADTKTGDVKFNVAASDSGYIFKSSGNYNYKDSVNNLVIDLQAEKINLNILEPYLGSVFKTISGMATSNLRVSGPTSHLKLTGQATIDSAEILVDYTKVKYLIKNETIIFREDEIDLGKMKITDTLNNEGVVSGKMHHTFFQKFSFENLRFETQRMILLNTTKADNNQFYGNVTGYGVMSLNGPITDMLLNIDGQPSSLDSSHIYLPTGATKESNAIDYIEFIQFGELMEAQRTSELANILVNLNIIANPACKIDVILDETTGDVIKGQGNGNINIRVGTKEPLSIRGRYDLTKGEYTFNFQTFFKKPFTLSRGTITWNGDPYEATIDIVAEYVAKNVDVSSIASAGGFKQKEDITIISHLTGVLHQPVIEFSFSLPEKSEIKNDYIAVKKLADFQNDKAEMNKQVASLLLFNSFISGSESFLSAENTLAIAASTVGGVVSGWLTNIFNKELEKATNGVISSYVDINPSVNLQSAASQLQANVRAGLKFLISKRLVVLVGGNIDYNNAAVLQLARKGLITPDISIEWLLNKDGSLRVVGFNRTSLDLTVGQRNRSGIQLSYRKDFDRLTDIFKSRKKIAELAKERREIKK